MTAAEEWEQALRAANEVRRAELVAGGEFTAKRPAVPPEYDPCDETTDAGRLMRSWLATGRGAVAYTRNGLEHEPKRRGKVT